MNTRPKRRRQSSSYSPSLTIEDKHDGGDCREQFNYTLETLPLEVFEMILRLLPFQDVAGSIRLVSRQCSTVATAVLNGAFLAAGIRLEATIRYIKSTIPESANVESDLLRWRALNVLELIKVQYKMLKAVTWRYTHPPITAKFRICFYAGSLIDELNSILDLAKVGPHVLTGALFNCSNNNNRREMDTAERAVAGSPRLVSFVSSCKRFMNYFEKVSECRVNRSSLVSGCKAVDILDCLAEGREVMGFRISSKRVSSGLPNCLKGSARTSSPIRDTADYEKIDGSNKNNTNVRDSRIITMRLRYVMKRAWFTCLQVPCAPEENSWREDQRFMYLRLRRLVGSVNEHYFEKVHFERDLMLLRTSKNCRLDGGAHQFVSNHHNQPLLMDYRPPPASTYSGYGVYAGRFFYYGNMNKYAYDSKFNDSSDRRVDSDDESGQDEGINNDEDNNGYGDDDNQHSDPSHVSSDDGLPAFDLIIRVELRCSSDLAPLSVISSLDTSELDASPSLLPLATTILDPSHCYNHYHNYMTPENSELYLKLNITCPASSANRLPANFTWEQRGSDHSQRQRQRRRQRRRRLLRHPPSSAH